MSDKQYTLTLRCLQLEQPCLDLTCGLLLLDWDTLPCTSVMLCLSNTFVRWFIFLLDMVQMAILLNVICDQTVMDELDGLVTAEI